MSVDDDMLGIKKQKGNKFKLFYHVIRMIERTKEDQTENSITVGA